ncbi:MAG TPA: helix-turn-helix domain-containing protein [Acidobacteriaceae bacterium]
MQILMSTQARPELQPYVRAYAQRVWATDDSALIEAVPSQLEQVLNFELGVLPGVRHREGRISDPAWIGGAQTAFPGYMDLRPGVESFAIFFKPVGWSLLFNIPASKITNRIADAAAVGGSCMRGLWNRLGEAPDFESRVQIVEGYLLERVSRVPVQNEISTAASYIFYQHGAVRIAELATAHSLGLRQFERKFDREIGVSPKTFARVARFQGALDAKLQSPQRTWLDIAHSFGYHDQMHMIHDFEALGHTTPTQLVAEMGDVRPPGLASAM